MPGIVDMFCNQSANWERLISDSEDPYGNPVYEASVSIRCRAVKARKLIRTETGEVIPTSWSILAKDRLDIGDRITVSGETFTILDVSVSDVIWIGGDWWGRWCFG